MKTLLLLSLCFCASHAELTDAEFAYFYNEGSEHCGGTVSITDNGDTYTITSNGLPDHMWACTNPNLPTEISRTYTVPKNPTPLDTPKCLGGGPIGVAANGVRLYGPLTSSQLNAVEGDSAEAFDLCGGHPAPQGEYHYHHLPISTSECDNPLYDVCIEDAQFLGIALDGYPIYSQGVMDGEQLEDLDMDECHGVTLPDGRYAYIAVRGHFPYLLGCFRAQPAGNGNQDCPTGGESGELCHCTDGVASWYDYSGVTTRSASIPESKSENLYNLLRSLLTPRRSRRSPRFNVMKHLREDGATIDSCHYEADTDYNNGECAANGNYQVNDEDMECSDDDSAESEDDSEDSEDESTDESEEEEESTDDDVAVESDTQETSGSNTQQTSGSGNQQSQGSSGGSNGGSSGGRPRPRPRPGNGSRRPGQKRKSATYNKLEKMLKTYLES